jgi:hypothetical protein
VTRRADFSQLWLWQMTICMTMTALRLLLSIPWTEYETPALENGSQAGGLTWMVPRRQVIRPRKELDLQSLHNGRVDLVIEGCFEDPLALCAAVAGSQALPEWARHNLRRGVSILQREGRLGSATQRWPPAPRDGCGGLDFEQDWTDHRPISRSSVKPRDAGNFA